jgi:hypothetical protein
MRYSIVTLDITDSTQSDITVTPVMWPSAVGDGEDIKLSQGDLDNYPPPVVDKDGVRLYSMVTFRGSYNLLFIPETHQYYNGGLVLHNFKQDDYEGSRKVAEMMKKMYKKIRKSV